MSDDNKNGFNWVTLFPVYGLYLTFKSGYSKKVLLYLSNIIISVMILFLFIPLKDNVQFLNNSYNATAKTADEIRIGSPTAQDLLNKLFGTWKNDQGEKLGVTEKTLHSWQLLPDGNFCGISSGYKLIGFEEDSQKTIRISVGEGAMVLDALVLFRDDNTIMFGYIGGSYMTLKKE